MGFAFNPFTGNFDQKGSGGGGGSAFFAGEVATYADLPLDGSAALDSRWLVRSNSGTWPFSSYKQSGVYVRKAIVGASRDNDYQLTDTSFFDVMSDSAFLIYDDGDATKNLKFELSGITTGTTRTLTAPDASGRIQIEGQPIGNTTPAAISGTTGSFTSLTATPAANTTALTSTGYSLTGSNAQSFADLSGTWNTTGTPTALKLNVTNTASNSASLLLDLQTGGTSRVSVRQDGRLNAQSYQVAATTVIERVGGFNTLNASCIVGWGGTGFNIGNTDLTLERDAADVMHQRRGTSSQEFRLAATYTSSTNYQRMTIKSVKQTLSALSGASATTTGTFIPDGAVVVGVTTRVATALTGAAGYTIGDGTDADRWGDITGTAVGTTSDNRNWTAGTIECFTAGGNITLTAKTANFTAGAIEISVFYLAGEAD
jgi:hypothetical protein